MREWSDVHQQLSRIVREMGLSPNERPAGDEAVHRALLPGLLSRVGMWHPEQRVYLGARVQAEQEGSIRRKGGLHRACGGRRSFDLTGGRS